MRKARNGWKGVECSARQLRKQPKREAALHTIADLVDCLIAANDSYLNDTIDKWKRWLELKARTDNRDMVAMVEDTVKNR